MKECSGEMTIKKDKPEERIHWMKAVDWRLALHD